MINRAKSGLFLSFLLAAVLLLANSTANADTFSATFHFGNINIADGSTPPQFFTGPFNYGFSPLGLDSAVSGLVNITNISVSADTVVNSPLVLTGATSWPMTGKSTWGRRPSASSRGK